MANDREDADRRLEAARQATTRQVETADFLKSLTKNDDLVKPIYNPEAWIARDQARSAATRGDIQPSGCTHPMAHLKQFVDDDPAVGRYGTPLNLFSCGACHTLIWFTDPWGTALSDN